MQKLFLPIFSFFLLISFFVSPFLKAQNEDAAAKPLPGDRCWGLNFMWQKDFNLGKQEVGTLNYDQTTPKDEKLTGFGVDWYLTPKSSLYLLGSVGISSDKTENTSGKNEYTSTELGAKVGWNFYPIGTNKSVYYSVGPWVNFVSYSDKTTITPTTGTESSNKLSTSKFGLGGNVSAYLKPWENLNWEFYAGYNLGVFISPESTITTTSGGQSTEIKGPSSFRFQDCGGMVGTRLYFIGE